MRNVHGARGAWVAQLAEGHPALAQVVIAQFMRSSPASGSLLSAWSLLRILCPPFVVPPRLVRARSLSLARAQK